MTATACGVARGAAADARSVVERSAGPPASTGRCERCGRRYTAVARVDSPSAPSRRAAPSERTDVRGHRPGRRRLPVERLPAHPRASMQQPRRNKCARRRGRVNDWRDLAACRGHGRLFFADDAVSIAVGQSGSAATAACALSVSPRRWRPTLAASGAALTSASAGNCVRHWGNIRGNKLPHTTWYCLVRLVNQNHR